MVQIFPVEKRVYKGGLVILGANYDDRAALHIHSAPKL